MKDLSLRVRIERYLRNHYPDWINGGEIERLALAVGRKASNASRRLREMESGNLSNGKTCPKVLEKEERKNMSGIPTVWYRYLPTEHEKTGWHMRDLIAKSRN